MTRRLFRVAQRVGRAFPAALVAAALLGGCGRPADPGIVLRFPASGLGAEAAVLRRQVERFMARHPHITVKLERTPDAADQRRQLYVQWLNARAGDPDVLQLDIVWTAEFAAAGWILPLDRFRPPADSFLPAAIAANTWRGRLYALPWFVDAGMLYRRTDLAPRAPATLDELARLARPADGGVGGFAWQGARYEGLVTVFQEVLTGFGGRIMDDSGRVTVDAEPGRRALEWLRNAVGDAGISPRSVLTWQEEQARFAFQNGRVAFMRNWPYAVPLLADSTQSRVAGRFAVSPMPGSVPGRPVATLGGQQLAINAWTEHPEAAWALIAFLAAPEQLVERARDVGQYPARPSLYDHPALAALPVAPEVARAIVASATPRPVTPVYTELSELLQIWLHRALTGQVAPDQAVSRAARDMRALLDRVGLRDAG